MLEKITSDKVFAPGLGWAKAVADRPYFDQLNIENANNDDYRVTVRLDLIPRAELLRYGSE